MNVRLLDLTCGSLVEGIQRNRSKRRRNSREIKHIIAPDRALPIKMIMFSLVVQTVEIQASQVSTQPLPRLLYPHRQGISVKVLVQDTRSFHKNTSEVCEDLLPFVA
jgi:hypothetical protein